MNEERQGGGQTPATGRPRMPEVAPVTLGDIRASLAGGISDFVQAPLIGLVVGGIFALIGIVITAALTVWDIPWMIYPFAIGFPLVGPFAAVALYEVSRRRVAHRPIALGDVLKVVWAQRGRELSWMAFVMLFVFWIWIYQVRLLIALVLGRMSFATLERFLDVLLTTPEGALFLVMGHIVGAVLALVLFSLTVVALPLLLERDVDFVTAMITSVKAVRTSPFVMLGWGLAVTVAVLAACLPFFLGLVVVLPVLGHATWHLYRRAVRPAVRSG